MVVADTIGPENAKHCRGETPDDEFQCGRFGVNNIFDRMPPIVPDSRNEFSRLSRSNTTPERYDPLGRYVNIGVNVNF